MILLDTNVVSELMRRTPEPAVVAWLDAQEASEVYISVIHGGGAPIWCRDTARGSTSDSAGRRARTSMPISHADCQIAAIARSRGESVATRNDGDFEHCGIEVINPWPATPDPDEERSANGV